MEEAFADAIAKMVIDAKAEGYEAGVRAAMDAAVPILRQGGSMGKAEAICTAIEALLEKK